MPAISASDLLSSATFFTHFILINGTFSTEREIEWQGVKKGFDDDDGNRDSAALRVMSPESGISHALL